MASKRVYLETFGCQMNELDSELVAGQLRTLGYAFTAKSEEADVVLYNTCSVREHAEQKVWSRLGELNIRKKSEPSLVVGVLGCMAERDGVDLIRRMPVVDLLCGPGELDKLPRLLDNAVRTRDSLAADETGLRHGKPVADISAREVALQGDTSRRSATLAAAADNLELLDLSRAVSPIDASGGAGTHGQTTGSAYVRITRGCNKFCTYCVVPFTRGAEVHRPPQHIIDECKKLADAGIIEVTLLGQTVNHYRFEHGSAVSVDGVMQPQKGRSYAGGHRRDPFAGASTTTFADLLAAIHDQVPSIQRLRFVTSYPRDFGDDVLEVIRDHPRICRYLHVPAQSGSNRILKLMNRGYTVEEYLDFLDRARAHLHQPEIGRPLTLSGDFIVGFPTETDEDFAATLSLARKARYKNSFIFKYSPRPGTTAFDKLADDVPEAVKRARNAALLELQTTMSIAVGEEHIGHTFSVFVEGLSPREKKAAARTSSGGCGTGLSTVMLTVGGRDTSSDFLTARTAVAELANNRDTIQLAARTDGDMIVVFDVPAQTAQALVGTIQRVQVTKGGSFALEAQLV